jgi:DNA-binding beta-propeller fold protein YncE
MRLILVLASALAVTAIAAAGNPPDPVATTTVATGPGPCGLAARAGSIWVGVYGSGELVGIDSASGRVEARVRVGRWACRVAVGPAAVWVTRDRAGEVVRVSRGTGRLRRIDVGGGAFDVLLVRGSLWVTSHDAGLISKIDPANQRITRVFKVGTKPAGLTLCKGRIWVGHGGHATWLTEISPATNAIRRVDVGTTNPGWPECIRDTVWVTASDTLLKIEAATGKVQARIRLGGTLAEAAEGPDALVWVTDKERSLVHRIYAQGGTVTDAFEAGPGAYSLVRTGDAMWITSFAGSDVRRYTR